MPTATVARVRPNGARRGVRQYSAQHFLHNPHEGVLKEKQHMAPHEAWRSVHAEIQETARQEPVLEQYLTTTILRHDSLCDALCALLAEKLASPHLPIAKINAILQHAFKDSDSFAKTISADLLAITDRDPAARSMANPFLNHKGFHALQAYRAAHWYWKCGRAALAHHLQSRISEVFAVDIHPAARIGKGVFMDHATGIVIGETAVVEDNVSLLQDVTLGGTGKETGDRHPKIGHGVLICAGAKILGNIRIGTGSKVGAGSVVLRDVAPHTTVVGVPARPVGRPKVKNPALEMDQHIESGSQLPQAKRRRGGEREIDSVASGNSQLHSGPSEVRLPA